MSRDLTSAVSTALPADTIRPFFAVDLLFDTPNELYLWSGVGDITIASKTYLGAGELLAVSAITETTEIAARGATVSLSGVPSSLIAKAINTPYQGRVCNVYFGVLNDTSTYSEIFSGYMDTMSIDEAADTGSISLSVESRLIDLERPRTLKYTAAYQKSIYPTDKGFDYVAVIQNQKLPWGDGLEV